MRWLIWRQHRAEAFFVVAAVVLIGGFLTLQHLSLVTTYHQLGLDGCTSADTPSCMSGLNAFANHFGWLDLLVYWLLLLPALVGVFVGAPLIARELELGTYRFIWTQSVGRTRWFLSTVAALLAGTILATALLSWTIAWTLEPLTRAEGLLHLSNLNPLTTPLFDLTGVAPIAAAVLALSVGILAGVLTRQTVLAMVITLVVFALVRVPVASVLRPHFAPPVVTTAAITVNSDVASVPPGAWVQKMGFLDRQGNVYDFIGGPTASCQQFGNDPIALQRCFDQLGVRSFAQYQPLSRYWPFQAMESSIYAAVALLSLLLAWWSVRWRIA